MIRSQVTERIAVLVRNVHEAQAEEKAERDLWPPVRWPRNLDDFMHVTELAERWLRPYAIGGLVGFVGSMVVDLWLVK